MNSGVLNKKRILSEDCILERRKPGIKIGDKMAYGLGLIIGTEQGLSIIGHDGATLGFSSLLFFLPEQGIGITMLANTRYAHPFLHAIKQKFLELSFSAPLRSAALIDSAIHAQQSAQKTTQESTSLEANEVAEFIRS